MVKFKLLLVTLLTTISVETGSAPVFPSLSFTITRKGSTSIYIVNYSGAKKGNIIVTVHDKEGYLMIQKTIPPQRVPSFPLNFISFSEGIYKVKISDGIKSYTLTVEYNNNTTPNYSKCKSVNKTLIHSSPQQGA